MRVEPGCKAVSSLGCKVVGSITMSRDERRSSGTALRDINASSAVPGFDRSTGLSRNGCAAIDKCLDHQSVANLQEPFGPGESGP